MSRKKKRREAALAASLEAPPEDDAPISRTQAKRDAKAVDPIAIQLVALKPYQLQKLELDDDLRQEIEQCRAMERTARRRQLRRIAGFLRQENWRAIVAAMHQLD